MDSLNFSILEEIIYNFGLPNEENDEECLERIYEELFGIRGGTIDPATSILKGGAPSYTLPTIRTDGLPDYPEIDELLNPTASPSPTVALKTGASR